MISDDNPLARRITSGLPDIEGLTGGPPPGRPTDGRLERALLDEGVPGRLPPKQTGWESAGSFRQPGASAPAIVNGWSPRLPGWQPSHSRADAVGTGQPGAANARTRIKGLAFQLPDHVMTGDLSAPAGSSPTACAQPVRYRSQPGARRMAQSGTSARRRRSATQQISRWSPPPSSRITGQTCFEISVNKIRAAQGTLHPVEHATYGPLQPPQRSTKGPRADLPAS